jgi:hypothetical protein
MRMKRGVAGALLIFLCALLVSCGQSTAAAVEHAVSPSAHSQAGTATPIATLQPELPPYIFPKHWLTQAGTPGAIAGFAFAPTDPRTGYTCAGLPSAGANAALPLAPRSHAAVPRLGSPLSSNASGRPGFYVTHDGGATWTAPAGVPFSWSTSCRVFVNAVDANDVFVSQNIGDANQPKTEHNVWRSKDGGQTWRLVGMPLAANLPVTVISLAVFGARLLVTVAPDVSVSGGIPNDLFGSDDGGATWRQMGQSILSQGVMINDLVSIGKAIVVHGYVCQSSCGMAAPLAPPRTAPRAWLGVALSGSPPPPTAFFESLDGGTSWTKLKMPAQTVKQLSVVLSADGSNYYCVATAVNVPNHTATSAVLYFSADSGVTWKELPTFDGVENGYVDPSSPANGWVSVTPAGAVIADTLHFDPSRGPVDAGAFILHPTEKAPSWEPLALLGLATPWLPVRTATGTRVWGAVVPPNATGGPPEFFDL